ncbi:MAG: cation diffusion facilitator family transporter, partial [Desulfobacteraceae bacterium]
MANTEIQPNKIMQLKRGQRIALISTLLILLLAVFKWLVGHFFNSQLLVADAWHSLSDVLINLTSLIGLWLASRKKTTRFPYGLYRAETLACFFIGGLIIYIGVDLFREGWGKLFQLELTTEFPVFPVGAALVSSGLACVLAVKQRAVGKAIGSQALMATARDAFFDIFTSLVVLAGILLVYAEIPYVEGVVVMIISILIVKLGIETAITSVLILMDANLDSDLQSEIEEKLNSIYGVKGVTGVKIRQSGPFKMVECIIRTNPSLPLYRTHSLADRAEEILFNDYDNIESAFVHVEPDKNYVIKAIVPVHSKDGINSRIHGHFGRAPYFMVF